MVKKKASGLPPMDKRPALAQAVNKLRKAVGSAERLARSIGKQSSTIWGYEGGKFEPSPDVLRDLAGVAREHGLEELARAFEADPREAPASVEGVEFTAAERRYVEIMLAFVRAAPAAVVEIECRRLEDYAKAYE